MPRNPEDALYGECVKCGVSLALDDMWPEEKCQGCYEDHIKRHNEYPWNWKEIATAVKAEAQGRCIRCGHHHEPKTGYTLTVHHLDGQKWNCVWWNLLALCQRCHLSVQGRVDPEQPYMFEHSAWFRVYVAGFYAHKYLGLELTKKQVFARLEELLALERVA